MTRESGSTLPSIAQDCIRPQSIEGMEGHVSSIPNDMVTDDDTTNGTNEVNTENDGLVVL